MNDKTEIYEKLKALGLDLRGPILPLLFGRSRFRRIVIQMGVGRIFNWFVRKFVVDDPGSGSPRLRNLHVHNGSGKIVDRVTVDREVHDPNGPPAPLVPSDGSPVLPDEWAINDSFEDDGHLADVDTLAIELESPDHLGTTFRGTVPLQPGQFVETVWMDVLVGPNGFRAEVILWVGQDDLNVNSLPPQTIDLL